MMISLHLFLCGERLGRGAPLAAVGRLGVGWVPFWGAKINSEPSPSLSRMKIIPGAMHVCHTILVRGNHYQRKTMKDECSNVLIAVILGYLEFFIFFFLFRTARNLFCPPQKGTQPTPYLPTNSRAPRLPI